MVLYRVKPVAYRGALVAASPEHLSGTTPLHRPALSVLTVGIGAFALYHVALAALMAFAPHAFYTQIGPFGIRNDHYIRDVASYNAALGFAFFMALRRRAWRVPVLALTTVQFALHSINHLVDIGSAHPSWNGYFDFFSLAALTVLLAWLWRQATLEGDRPA
jgi:hypothetical protein